VTDTEPAPELPLFGIRAIDDAILPVLPAGCVGLIEGETGSGTQLLAKQAAHMAAGKLPVYYYSTQEPTDEIRRVFSQFGWSSDDIAITDLNTEFYQTVLQRDLEVSQARARGLTLSEASLNAGFPPTPLGPPALSGRLLADIAPLNRPFRFVLDSFDLILENYAPDEATRVARQIRHQARAVGGTAILLVQPAIPDARTKAILESFADFILQLRLVEEGTGFYPRIAITKVRDHPDRTRILRGRVGDQGFDAHV
jgi:KaiC/GvpD/RAD55 family RecA-like ATPase